MTPEKVKAINARVFDAVDQLKGDRKIKSVRAFSMLCGIDPDNFRKPKAHPDRYTVRTDVLARLVEDYNVSADWLLCGKGTIYRT